MGSVKVRSVNPSNLPTYAVFFWYLFHNDHLATLGYNQQVLQHPLGESTGLLL